MTELLDFYELNALGAVVSVVLVAAASARLTRLVVQDAITRPLFDGISSRLHARADRHLEESVESRTMKALKRAQRSNALAEKYEELTGCSWCVSVWTTSALVIAWPW